MDGIMRYDTTSLQTRSELISTIREQEVIIDLQEERIKNNISQYASMEAKYAAKLNKLNKTHKYMELCELVAFAALAALSYALATFI